LFDLFPTEPQLANTLSPPPPLGLFPVSQSSECYLLTEEERLETARVVKETSAGRVPVLASGTFAETVEEMVPFVKKMAEIVDVVVVLVPMMAKKEEGEDVWKANVQKLMDLTPGIPLGLYECPAPYHRLLSKETILWLAQSGRVSFHKDTSRRNDLITGKIQLLKEKAPKDGPFRWYNGNCTTLLHSLKEGGRGCGLVSANFYPWFVL
jgi:4-hydroxy-tetrahydrodipicolinate synthase